MTDNQTGLMWEKKTSTCSGEVTCVNNAYSWSLTGTPADGTLFTTFIAGLNGGDYYSQSAGQIVSAGTGTCLANHCDWRIPTVAELNTIVESAATGCDSGSPCIDTAFVPTQAFFYWSSSSLASSAFRAWYVDFNDGYVYGNFKTSFFYARAVRSGR